MLSVSTTLEKAAEKFGLGIDELEKKMAKARAALLSARRQRNRPSVDDKILASWNGLAISGFACAYQALQEPRYLAAATKCADFVLNTLVKKGTSPMLFRRYRDGDVAIAGVLEDYSFLIAGLLDLYEASFEMRWMGAATSLAGEMTALFWDADVGGFFLKPPQGDIVAIKEGYDGPTPSGNSVAAMDLLRLAEFTGNKDYKEMAETTLKLFAEPMETSPTGYLEMLGAVDFSFGSKEIVVAKGWEPGELQAMVREVQTRYLPTKVLALADGDPALAPLTEGKASLKGRPTVYVCENFACKAPVTDVLALKRELDTGTAEGGAAS